MKRKDRFDNWFDITVSRIEALVQVPKFEDHYLQRQAEIIHTLSSAVLVMALATISITPFIFTDQVLGLGLTAGIVIFMVVIQVFNRMGRTKLAAGLFTAGIWLFDTAVITLSGGSDSSYLLSYISITVMGGLILGNMAALQIAGLSISAYLILFYLTSQNSLPEPMISFTPIALIIINIVNIFLAAAILFLVLTKYEENISDLSEKEATLSNINQKMAWEISARQEAETLLRQSEERLKSAIMDSPYPTMLHAEDGEILLINNAWVDKSGYTLQDLNSLDDWLNVFFRESGEQASSLIEELISENESLVEDHFNLHTINGQTVTWFLRWANLPELPDGRKLILSIATDLTSLQNVESALRESEENLSKFTLVTNDGLWDWDLTTDEVLFDPRYYTMAGYEVDEFPHRLEEFRKRVHPNDVQEVFQIAEEHLKGRRDRFRVEFRYKQKDGSWMWILGRGKVTEQDEYGNPLRLVGTHTDISAQKEIEQQLSQHQQQLEQIVEDRTQSLNERIAEVERLNTALTNILDDYQIANEKLTILSSNLSSIYQELESVTYSMSTGLQSPVEQIVSNVEKLLSNHSKSLTAGGLKKLREVHDHAALVNQRIQDLLDISLLNRQQINQEDVNVRELVEGIVKEFDHRLQENKTKLIIKELPPCQADRELLQQVFRNLLENAIKFTAQEEDPEVVIGSQPGERTDRVRYYIQDNGLGFKVKDQDKIFQTFQQLHDQEQYQGAGIGLTLAKIIITKHGGEIWAEGEPGSGATFFFELYRTSSSQNK